MKTSCTIVSDTVCEPLEGFYCSDSRKDDCVEARKHRRCEPGEYIREHEKRIKNVFLLFQTGSCVHEDCTDSGSTFCKHCTEGTFMDQPTSRTRCYICKSCDEGSALKMKTSCTIKSDTVCEPLEGFYCSDSRKDDCVEAKKHRRCEPGEYIREHGTSSTDTVCSTCSDGTFSDGTFPILSESQTVSEGRELLRAGTETEDAQCGDIPSDWTGLIVCVVVGVMFLVSGLGMCYFKRRKIRHLISGKVSTVTMKHDHVYFIDIMVCFFIYLIFISNVLFQETKDIQDPPTRYVLNSLYSQSVLCSMI
uniref:TNFR-Cys domain-containing protein n=1 Tax=Labrus bergylta TaxID=56723 RepID=A0A3Q3EP57_9LABR